MSIKTFQEEDEDTWVIDEFTVPNYEHKIRVSVYKEEVAPSLEEIEAIVGITKNLANITLKCAELILENYSYEYFKDLGVSEDKLPKENPKSVAEHISLREIYFFDIDEVAYECSFESSWDPHHSFDVECEADQPISCAVNG